MPINTEKLAALELDTLTSEELCETAKRVLQILAVRKVATIQNGTVRIKWESGKSEFTLRGVQKTVSVFE